MLALEMDAMTYPHELDWALSSAPMIEASIFKFPFSECPARRLYTILQIDNTAAQGVRCVNFYRWVCDFNDEQPVANPTLESHAHLRAQFQKFKQRMLQQMMQTAPTTALQAIGNKPQGQKLPSTSNNNNTRQYYRNNSSNSNNSGGHGAPNGEPSPKYGTGQEHDSTHKK